MHVRYARVVSVPLALALRIASVQVSNGVRAFSRGVAIVVGAFCSGPARTGGSTRVTLRAGAALPRSVKGSDAVRFRASVSLPNRSTEAETSYQCDPIAMRSHAECTIYCLSRN